MRTGAKWGIGIGAIIVVVIAALAIFFFWPEPRENIAAAAKPSGDALIKRGEYLTRAADCAGCHTSPDGREFVGGRAFKLPFGTIYSTNLTPDKETGIGAWSDADFVRALHRGVDREGKMLYPVFPYDSYALMSTEDALAIKAYLFSLPPVAARHPRDEVKFPYNQRYLLRAWRVLFVPGHRFEADPKRPDNWNHGAYLVEALGHCGACHTPRNALYGLDETKKFAGAVVQGWKAYNITSDRQSGIGDWSDQQIADYLTKGFADGRGPASGPMAEAVEYSLRHLGADDIKAMIAYLRSVPPQDTGVKANPEAPALVASNEFVPPIGEAHTNALGLQIFQSACASCHGWDGKGIQDPRASLTGSSSVNDPGATNLLRAILHGTTIRTATGESFMPSFGAAYTDAEIAALSNYVIAHFGGRKASVTPNDVAKARQAD